MNKSNTFNYTNGVELAIEYDFDIWDDITQKLCAQFSLTPEQLDDILFYCFPDYERGHPAFFLNMDNKWFNREIPKLIRIYKKHLPRLQEMALDRDKDDGIIGTYARYYARPKIVRDQDATELIQTYVNDIKHNKED